MADEVTTWHHGLIARWWAEFNQGGPEIEFYRCRFSGDGPVLDAACGTGRLLVPWARDGVDVDGVDASADMIAACGEAAAAVGLTPSLYVQPLHSLALPRLYETVVMCASFGLGGTVEDDRRALDRLRAHLLPGGRLLLDYEVGEFDEERLRQFSPTPLDVAPPEPGHRRRGSDGFDYALRGRMVEADVDLRRVVREIQAWKWAGDDLVAHETHQLVANWYTADDITEALIATGFVDISVVGGYHDGPPCPDDAMQVWIAHAPAS